jgi:YfiH family protein
VSVVDPKDAERSGESLRRALGVEGLRAARVDQVHGTDVIVVPRTRDGGAPALPPTLGAGDALASDQRGVALEIRVADCVPIFAVDPRRRLIGLAHAGWRGTLAGVAGRLVAALRALGASPRDLIVWIGPSIGPECYEVGPEVFGPFRERFGPPAVVLPNRVDLWSACRADLLRAGVAPEAIHTAALCTRCRGDLLHSHRGSGGRPGRNVALLASLPN